ncbi:MAG: hypothetical protein ACK4UJ_10030 [Leptonema sp. (in: bacteria)]
MPFYITDIFPYLKKESQKSLERQLNIVLKNTSQYETIKPFLLKVFKKKFVPKLKKILLSNQDHLIKQIFLEGGFVDKEYVQEYPYNQEIPLIEFQNNYYLPNEIYSCILYDKFFLKNRYLIGFLPYITEKDLQFWYNWQREVSNIHYEIPKPIKKNLIQFYFFLLLNPISLNVSFFPKSKEYDFIELFSKIVNHYPFSLYVERNFSFYQTLRKLYFSKINDYVKIEKQKIKLKELLIYFLCGKLVPLFKNSRIEKIYLTKELRDIEFSEVKNKNQNLIPMGKLNKF